MAFYFLFNFGPVFLTSDQGCMTNLSDILVTTKLWSDTINDKDSSANISMIQKQFYLEIVLYLPSV